MNQKKRWFSKYIVFTYLATSSTSASKRLKNASQRHFPSLVEYDGENELT